MNTIQINKIMNKDTSANKIYLGTFARDELPEKIIYPSALILNTQPSSHAGEHWLAIYFDKNKKGVFFDSYGKSASSFKLEKFMKKHSKSYKENRIKLQSNTSSYCGVYAVLFLLHMSKNLVLESFQRKFKTPMKNDTMIKNFFDNQ